MVTLLRHNQKLARCKDGSVRAYLLLKYIQGSFPKILTVEDIARKLEEQCFDKPRFEKFVDDTGTILSFRVIQGLSLIHI